MKRLICFIRGIKTFFECGSYIPHIYSDTVTEAIIGATENKFRVMDNYEHKKGETVYTKAALICSTCKTCGHKEYSWHPSYKKWLEMNEEK